jgi:signal transduction histidine kinase
LRMSSSLISPAREALKEVRRLEERLEQVELEVIALKEAAHAQANATNTAVMRLQQEVRKIPMGGGD